MAVAAVTEAALVSPAVAPAATADPVIGRADPSRITTVVGGNTDITLMRTNRKSSRRKIKVIL